MGLGASCADAEIEEELAVKRRRFQRRRDMVETCASRDAGGERSAQKMQLCPGAGCRQRVCVCVEND
jgi:hypothetical protein